MSTFALNQARRKVKTYPPWIELPRDVTANILHRVGAIEILQSVEKVCTTWHKVCKDPAMWREIDMRHLNKLIKNVLSSSRHEKICREAVDRSQGDLVDIHLDYFASDKLFDFIGKRSGNVCRWGKLRRLHLSYCQSITGGESFTKLIIGSPLLEEFHSIITPIDVIAIETVSRSCPLLKSFAFNERPFHFYCETPNEYALAIARSMHELRRLELIGNGLTNEGLEAILNGCPHLELLDLCLCHRVQLKEDLVKRLSVQIKCVRYPNDSIPESKDYDTLMDVCEYFDVNQFLLMDE